MELLEFLAVNTKVSINQLSICTAEREKEYVRGGAKKHVVMTHDRSSCRLGISLLLRGG